MKAISIRELHLQTGLWVRRSQKAGPLVVTDHGRPIAKLVPYDDKAKVRGLPNRESEIMKLPRIPVDSADLVSEGRERE